MTVSQYRTLAAMLRLRTFTAEQLVDATGLALPTIQTHLSRMGRGLQATKLPPTGPGALRNMYFLSAEEAANIRERLLNDGLGLGNVDLAPQAGDAEEVQDESAVPSALLAAEGELLKCPPLNGDPTSIAQQLRRANALLTVADGEIDSRTHVGRDARERLLLARALANLISEELVAMRSPSHSPQQNVLRTAAAWTTTLSSDPEVAELQERIKSSPLLSRSGGADLHRSHDASVLVHLNEELAMMPEGLKSGERDLQMARAQLTSIVRKHLLVIDNNDELSHETETLLFLLGLTEAESALESDADFETRVGAVRSFGERIVELTMNGYVPDWSVLNRIRKSKLMRSYVRSLLDQVRSLDGQQPGLTIVPLDSGDAVMRITEQVSQVAEASGAFARVMSIPEESSVTPTIREIAEGAMSGSHAGVLPVVLATEAGRGERQRASYAVAAAAEVAPVVLLADGFDPYFSNLALKHHALFVSMHGVDTDALVSALRLTKKPTPD